MEILKIDIKNVVGKIKPMHAVNNGPVYARNGGNVEKYKALELPYARYHDSSLGTSCYGGEWSVDVHRIFRNFDADENDPANYIFEPTDKYVKQTFAVGTKAYYRLGAAIEHGYKYGTYPPKDFHKWARICENIIRHYTEGWGNGFKYDIEYWEIWNEPDCYNPDGSNPCWQGTVEQFIDFYEIAAKYLKAKFPHLKIGGPAFTSSWHYEWITPFLKAVKERNIPMDFYSFHGYLWSPIVVKELSDAAVESFEKVGLEKIEFHLNEWNYMRNWADSYDYSLRQIGKIKGASFVLGSMCVGQISDIDMMMYYDARPSAFNGLFAAYFYDPLKPYYSFKYFSEIYKLGYSVNCEAIKNNIFTIAATNGKESAIALTYFTPEDSGDTQTVNIKLENVKSGAMIEYYLLDEENDGALIKKEALGEDCSITLELKLFDSYLIIIKEA
jgi:hypothetical protein